mmetsp:Transcript_21706/g.34815  ORF Transcript_21706/g.34815 Transcript_21706/m.34815 type:complete len:225 (-) Transcript_21706:521-1195(-)
MCRRLDMFMLSGFLQCLSVPFSLLAIRIQRAHKQQQTDGDHNTQNHSVQSTMLALPYRSICVLHSGIIKTTLFGGLQRFVHGGSCFHFRLRMCNQSRNHRFRRSFKRHFCGRHNWHFCSRDDWRFCGCWRGDYDFGAQSGNAFDNDVFVCIAIQIDIDGQFVLGATLKRRGQRSDIRLVSWICLAVDDGARGKPLTCWQVRCWRWCARCRCYGGGRVVRGWVAT